MQYVYMVWYTVCVQLVSDGTVDIEALANQIFALLLFVKIR